MTNQYLDGKLTGLIVNYVDTDKMLVSLTYKYNSYFTIDYDVEVDYSKQNVKFLYHGSSKAFEKIRLNDEPRFDKALQHYFFS